MGDMAVAAASALWFLVAIQQYKVGPDRLPDHCWQSRLTVARFAQ
jgi:hypothetical protein